MDWMGEVGPPTKREPEDDCAIVNEPLDIIVDWPMTAVDGCELDRTSTEDSGAVPLAAVAARGGGSVEAASDRTAPTDAGAVTDADESPRSEANADCMTSVLADVEEGGADD